MNKYLFIIVFLFPLSLIAENMDDLEKERLDLISKIEDIENDLDKESDTENGILSYILDNKGYGISKEEGISYYKNVNETEAELDRGNLKEILKILIDIGSNRSRIDRLKAEEAFISLYEEIGITEEFKEYLTAKSYIADEVVNKLYLKYLESSGDPDNIAAAKYLSYLGLSPFEILNNEKDDKDIKDYLWDLTLLDIKPNPVLSDLLENIVAPETLYESSGEVEKLVDLLLIYDYWDIISVMLGSSSIRDNIFSWDRFFSSKTDREIIGITIDTNIPASKLIRFRDLVRLLKSRSESSEFKLVEGII